MYLCWDNAYINYFQQFLVNLNINQYILLGIGILALIPSYKFFQSYRQTKIGEFRLFGIMFITVSSAAFSLIIGTVFEITSLFKVQKISLAINAFIFYRHAVRVKWDKSPKILNWISYSWFAFVVGIILLAKPMMQPDVGDFIFIGEVPHSNSSYHPLGVSLLTATGKIIYGSSFTLILDLYRIFCVILLLWVYLRLIPYQPIPRITKAKRLWQVTWLLLFFWSIFQLPWFTPTRLVDLMILTCQILIIVVVLKYPEGLVITEAQILRIRRLYRYADEPSIEEKIKDKQNLDQESLFTYMKNVFQIMESAEKKPLNSISASASVS